MKKEAYERVILNVTQFDKADVIATSGEDPIPGPGGGGTQNTPSLTTGRYEIPIGF